MMVASCFDLFSTRPLKSASLLYCRYLCKDYRHHVIKCWIVTSYMVNADIQSESAVTYLYVVFN